MNYLHDIYPCAAGMPSRNRLSPEREDGGAQASNWKNGGVQGYVCGITGKTQARKYRKVDSAVKRRSLKQ